MANQNATNSNPSSVLIPASYPTEPTPGKLSLLFNENSKILYNKYDPKSYDNGSFFGSSQPYIYKKIGSDTIGGRGFPAGFGVDDVVRVSKFIGSGRGLAFVGKQFVLQGFQPFDETNLYNPSEIILSAAANLTGGILQTPKRHIDKSGGLLGGLASLVGIGISRGSPPPSTVAASGGGSGGFLSGLLSNVVGSDSNRESEVLPVQNYGNATGLLRGKTATKAKSILQAKWGTSSGGGGGGILGFITGLAKSMFPQVFGSDKQKGVKQRADELSYDWMVKYYNDITANNLAQGTKSSGLSLSFMGISLKKSSSTKTSTQMTNAVIKLFKQKYYFKTSDGSKTYNADFVYIRGNDEKSELKDNFDKSVFTDDSNLLQKQRDTYFNTKGWVPVDDKSPIGKAFDLYKQDNKEVTSTELVKNSEFNKSYEGEDSDFNVFYDNTNGKSANGRSPSQNTKLNKAQDSNSPASQINDSLKRVISNINRSGIYNIEVFNKDSWLISSGNPSKQGYDRLHDISKTSYNMKNNKNSVESAYYDNNVRTLDSIINSNKNYGMAGNGRPDKINTLTVLDKDKNVKEHLIKNYKEWNPYDDDIIAFFFYDVVNEKYIPFRATVKGISESNNALWDELRFMGRSDALYSYTGFTRNLSFSFTVVVNSLVELYPVWNRINYLASSVKPSGYTKKLQNDGITNRFVIPPMFMLTIGDLYKYQPIVITTVSITVPENASWEVVPENSTEEWSYLAKIIKSNIPKEKIGQVPREVEISIACNVLEKERPIVGGNHFGHAIRAQLFASSDIEHLQYPEGFSKNIRTVTLSQMDD